MIDEFRQERENNAKQRINQRTQKEVKDEMNKISKNLLKFNGDYATTSTSLPQSGKPSKDQALSFYSEIRFNMNTYNFLLTDVHKLHNVQSCIPSSVPLHTKNYTKNQQCTVWTDRQDDARSK